MKEANLTEVIDQIAEAEAVWDLRTRTKQFAISCIQFATQIPNSGPGKVISSQLIRCATSVGANYRAAALAQSRASFVSKLSIALEEVDESAYWLELLSDMEIVDLEQCAILHREADELTRIFVSSRKSARANSNK